MKPPVHPPLTIETWTKEDADAPLQISVQVQGKTACQIRFISIVTGIPIEEIAVQIQPMGVELLFSQKTGLPGAISLV